MNLTILIISKMGDLVTHSGKICKSTVLIVLSLLLLPVRRRNALIWSGKDILFVRCEATKPSCLRFGKNLLA